MDDENIERVRKTLICPTCFNTRCDHVVEKFECDELMVYPLQKLNELGYKTKFCCSLYVSSRGSYKPCGFISRVQTYILFDKMYNFETVPEFFECHLNTVHKSWILESVTPCSVNDYKKKTEHILIAVTSLYNWLEKLIPYDDSEYILSEK